MSDLTILDEKSLKSLSTTTSFQPPNNKPKFVIDPRVASNVYYEQNKVIVKMSHPEMGLGVFALKDLEAGELIERCPLVQLGWRRNYIGDPQISRYCYPNSACKCEECARHGSHMFMVLGYGMIYNHQDNPNALWNFIFQNSIGDLIARGPIKKGEEIFVSYGPHYFKNIQKHTVSN